MKKNVLVVRPCFEDFKELEKFSDYNFIYHDYTPEELEATFHGTQQPLPEIVREIAQSYQSQSLAGVMYTSDFVGPALGSLIAHHLGLKGPDPEKLFLCQHKYEARKVQQLYVPEAVPKFDIFDINEPSSVLERLGFPLFIKPVKSVFSKNSYAVESLSQAKESLKQRRPIIYEKLFSKFITHYTPYTFPNGYYLAEGLLEGQQCTLEGIICDGKISILGVIDSIMFNNKISFERFEYPSRLPLELQEKMASITTRFIDNIGLDNSYFNIEFMCDVRCNTTYIIEINPRIATQFTDLYEKVDGTSSYQWLLELVTGEKPKIIKSMGKHNVAASCVLRTFEDKYVVKVPCTDAVEKFYQTFPDGRFELCCQVGTKLSDGLQDSQSFMYGLINLGADSWPELYEAFEKSKQILNFELAPL